MPADSRDLGVEITNAIYELQQQHPESSPRSMLAALVKVTCGFAAVHRIDDQDPLQMGGWLAAYVHEEFKAAHRHITQQRQKIQPAG
jgi:hypothetical protein